MSSERYLGTATPNRAR